MAVALREVLAFFQVDWDKSALDAGGKSVDSAIDKLKKFAGVIGGSAIVVGLQNMVSSLEQQASALDDSATQVGLAAEELQTYRYAAKMAGVEVQAFDSALQILNVNQGAAAEGSKAQAEAFKAVGVAAEGAALAEMSLSELLPQIADGLAKVTSHSERARLAKQLLGKQGAKLAPMLGEGAAGIEKFRKEIALLGGGLSGDGIKDLAEYGDQMDRLDMATTSLKMSLGSGIVPALSVFAEKLAFGLGRVSQFTSGIASTIKNSNILRAVFLTLGPAVAGKLAMMAFGWTRFGALVAKFGFSNVIGKLGGGWAVVGRMIVTATRALAGFIWRLALPALLIDEMITTWQGGDTIISRSIDKLFGEGATAKVIGFFKFMTSGWEAAQLTIEEGAFMLGAILVGVFDAMGFSFTRFTAGAQDDAAAMWNWIIEQTAAAVAKIQSLIGGIPGIGGLLDGATEKLAGLKASGGNLEQATQSYEARKGERVEAFDASKARLSDAMGRFATQQNVSAPTQINVTVPPGTPATLANRVGQSTAKAVTQSRRATKAATVNQVD